jgi:iron complex outermembrane receptor protein
MFYTYRLIRHISSKIFSIFLLLNALSAFTPATAQNSLSGYVRDAKTKEALPAIVYLPDLKRGVAAGTDGRYKIDNLPAANMLLEVRFIGYATKTLHIKVSGEARLDILLEPTEVEVNQVVVTGTSRATEINKSPIPTVTIDKQFLQRNESTNLIESLAKVPGVSTVTTGPNVSKPFIRGLGYNRILTMYDGVRQEGQQWGDEHGEEIDEYSVDRVEIIKGPASLIYGSDALAGVINLLPPNPVPEGKILGNVTTNFQSNNDLIAGSADVNGTQKGINFQGRLTHKQAMDYQNKIDGHVYGTAFAENDASLSAGVNKAWGYSRIGFSLYNDLQEIPDGSRDSVSRKFTKQISEADTFRPMVSPAELRSYRIQPLHQYVQHYKVYTNNSFQIGDARLNADLGYQYNHRQEFTHPMAGSVAGLDLNLQTITYNVSYAFAEKKGWEPTAGINGMYQANNITGTEFLIPDYHLFDGGAFAFVKKTIKKLDVSSGIRYDKRIFNGHELYTATDAVTGFNKIVNANTPGAIKQFNSNNRDFNGVSGSVGATYAIKSGFSLKANVARGYRAPNVYEISSQGVHPGTNIYQMSNPDFKPEQSLQEDLGMLYTSKHISIDASVFNNDIQNYIYNRRLAEVIVPGNQTFQFTAGHARLYGGEASIDIHPHPLDWLHFENSIALVYGLNLSEENDPNSKYLPYIPPLHTDHELRADIKKHLGRLANIYAKAEVEYYARQNRAYLAYGTETPTAGYTLLDAGIGANVLNKAGHTILTFDILGTNLADVAYQNHLSRLKYFEPYPNDPRPYHGIYNMGRNISVRVVIPINIK